MIVVKGLFSFAYSGTYQKYRYNDLATFTLGRSTWCFICRSYQNPIGAIYHPPPSEDGWGWPPSDAAKSQQQQPSPRGDGELTKVLDLVSHI